jgi:hypothetical protein
VGIRKVPGPGDIKETLKTSIDTLNSAPSSMRPPDTRGRAGGLVYLPNYDYVVIVPDLHGRGDFLRAVLAGRLAAGRGSVEDDLERESAAVICVGDAFHSEARGKARWQREYREFPNGYSPSPAIDEEMSESLDTVLEVARLQKTYPERFPFLKGNHENIANERKEGNFPFRKFAYEGDMVREWVLHSLGREDFETMYRWEKALPLATAGDGFLVTHAEPADALTPEDIIEAYNNPETVVSLTWTDNGCAAKDSAAKTLESFFPGRENSRIFGGHRPVRDRFSLRQGGRYVQINTPDNWVVAVFEDIVQFIPDRDIIELAGRSDFGTNTRVHR